VRGDEPVAVIQLAGELEIGRREYIHETLSVHGWEQGVLVDLSEATYADSTTLSELLRFREDADRLRIPVVLLIGSRQLARIIQYAGLKDAFNIFEDRDAALAHLAEAVAI
jgi:anti-anti-sigma factor